MLEELKTDCKVVGIKQIKKALAAGKVKKVFIARDADPALTQPLLAQCKASGITLEKVSSMRQLGDACEISVSAAAAAIV